MDSKAAYDKILEFMAMTMPTSKKPVELYQDAEPLFTKYKVEEQIERIHRNRVPLPGGGSIVIEQTEALVAIDVNSGRFKQEANAEATAYQINLQAAAEIGRQIRLRDLGGLILSDFIDMRDESHKRDVERKLWETLKNDRARMKMLRMSRFGIIEMTRQRMRRSIEFTDYQTCPTCKGTRPDPQSGEHHPRNAPPHPQHGHPRQGPPHRRAAPSAEPHPPPERAAAGDRGHRERTGAGASSSKPGEDLIDNIDIKCYKH